MSTGVGKHVFKAFTVVLTDKQRDEVTNSRFKAVSRLAWPMEANKLICLLKSP